MTMLDNDLRFAGPGEQFVPAWSPETDEQKAAYAEMAHDAVEYVDAQLAYSPRSTNYLTSSIYLEAKRWLDEHAPMIEAELAYRLGELSLDNAAVDLWHLSADEFKDTFAKAGIEDVLQKKDHLTPDTPTDEIDASSTTAISAMLNRGIYLRMLSAAHPDEFPPRMLDGYLFMLEQNILGTVQRAGQFTAEHH